MRATIDPAKAQLSAEVAEQVRQWELKHGPIQAVPCAAKDTDPDTQAFTIKTERQRFKEGAVL